MTITQIFLVIFLIFAISRVFLRFTGGILSLFGFIFWTLLFGSAIVVVLFPGLTGKIANITGVGRGADIVIYISMSLIFYLVFRLYIFIEDMRHDITELVKKIAIENEKNNKTSQN